MDKNQIIAIIALVTAFVSLFSVFLYEPVTVTDETEVFTVYFGLTDTEGDAIDVTTAKNVINGLCESQGLGFTTYEAFGGYVSNGTLVTNDSLVYIFALTDEDAVLSLVAEAKTDLNIDSAMFEKSLGTFSFI